MYSNSDSLAIVGGLNAVALLHARRRHLRDAVSVLRGARLAEHEVGAWVLVMGVGRSATV